MININNESAQTIQALARINQLGNTHLFKFIEKQVDETKTKLVTAVDDAQLRRLQGRAEAFIDFLKAVDDAAKIDTGQ